MRAIILLLALSACSKPATDDYSAEINNLAAQRKAMADATGNLQAAVASHAVKSERAQNEDIADLKRRVTDLERKRLSDDLDRRATLPGPDR